MSFYVDNGYPIFTGTDGLPLADGYLFIGDENLNPLSNPQQAYWDVALTIPASDIRISNGYAMFNGSPGRLYTENAFSILVQDSNRETVYYNPSGIKAVAST